MWRAGWAGLFLFLVWALAGGCASDRFLDSSQPAALRAAEARGRFELDCSTAKASVLSRSIVYSRSRFWYGGAGRAQYTIGVRGCGRRAVYITLCMDEDNCSAVADRGSASEP